LLIETTELTLSHVGSGALDEVALMTLFASAHCHRITEGTGLSVRDITDASGAALHPSCYWTHLVVPADAPIERHRVWDRVDVGVEVRGFGRMILDASYVLAADGELTGGAERGEAGDPLALPRMRSGLIFMVAGTHDPRPSAPRQGSLGHVDQVDGAPESLERFRRVQASGVRAIEAEPGPLRTAPALRHVVRAQRDSARGRPILFTVFTSMMDQAETLLLSRRIDPAFSAELLEQRSLLERETFYLESCSAGDRIELHVWARLKPPTAATPGDDHACAAELNAAFEMYSTRTGRLLLASRARKLLRVPRARASLLREAERLLTRHGA
jgi:probable biosynthetic protein (TIGR04098 family)